jgi:hypothetical protein
MTRLCTSMWYRLVRSVPAPAGMAMLLGMTQAQVVCAQIAPDIFETALPDVWNSQPPLATDLYGTAAHPALDWLPLADGTVPADADDTFRVYRPQSGPVFWGDSTGNPVTESPSDGWHGLFQHAGPENWWVGSINNAVHDAGITASSSNWGSGWNVNAIFRTGIGRGSRLKFRLDNPPGMGDFLDPSPTLAGSSIAVLPPMSAHKPTGWQDIGRPTIDGAIDLVTGVPLVQFTDVELPFGGAIFRLTRTRSAAATRWQHRYDGNELHPWSQDVDQWWDWAGNGWMMSENPLLLIDSALPDVVGDNPRTCYLLLDAHRSIPFQLIESNGTYEAPPRFRARMEYQGGSWDASTRTWLSRPKQYTVHLYDRQVSYTFAAVYDDVPESFYDPARVEDGEASDVPADIEVTSLHNRPFLPQQLRRVVSDPLDQRRDWRPFAYYANRGFGIPFYGLCTEIRDANGNKAEITYVPVEVKGLTQSASGQPQCYTEVHQKGQISNVKLVTASGNVAWTLVYANRIFRGDWREISSEIDPTYTTSTPQSGITEAVDVLQVLRGRNEVDTIYIHKGDLALDPNLDITLGNIGTEIDQLAPEYGREAPPDVDAISWYDSHAQVATGLASVEWAYKIKYRYDEDVPCFDDAVAACSSIDFEAHGVRYPVCLTSVTVDCITNLSSSTRVMHYSQPGAGTGRRGQDNVVMIEYDAPFWLERMYSPDDVATLVAASQREVADPTGEHPLPEFTAASLAAAKTAAGKSIFSTDSTFGGVPDEPTRQRIFDAASLQLADVNRDAPDLGDGVGGDTDGTYGGWSESTAVASDNLGDDEDGDGYDLSAPSAFLYSRPPSDLLIATKAGLGDDYIWAGGAPAEQLVNGMRNTDVAMSSIRGADGVVRHRRMHSIMVMPFAGPPPVTGTGFHLNNAFEALMGAMAAEGGEPFLHPSAFFSPYAPRGYFLQNEDAHTIGVPYSSNESDFITPPGVSATGEPPVRWVRIIDEFVSREAMVDTEVYYGGPPRATADDSVPPVYTYGNYADPEFAIKDGQLSRRVVELTPSGLVVRDRTWTFSEGTDDEGAPVIVAEATGGGIGSHYKYQKVETFFDEKYASQQGLNPLPSREDTYPDCDCVADPNCRPDCDSITSGFMFANAQAIHDELIPVLWFSSGWSVADIAGDGDTDGLVQFFDYDVIGTTTTGDAGDWAIKKVLEGIQQGEQAGSSSPTRWYSRQYIFDDERPFGIAASIEFTTSTSQPLAAADATSSAIVPTIEGTVITRQVSEYDTTDPDNPVLTAQKTIGPPRRVRPGGDWYFPVEAQFFDEDGNSSWSASAFTTNPDNPSADQGDPFASVILTYFDRDSDGRAKNTAVDVPRTASVLTGPDGGQFTPDISSIPSSWGRVPASGAEPRITTYVYSGSFSAMSALPDFGIKDIYQDNGRRWSRREVILDDGDSDDSNDVLREFIFEQLTPLPDKTITGGPFYAGAIGEVNDYPPGVTDSRFSRPEIRRKVYFALEDPASTSVPPDMVPTEIQNLDSGETTEIWLQGFDETHWTQLAAAKVAIDADGRARDATLLERDPSGAMLEVGTKETNELGEMFREREIDGTITRLTRDSIGHVLRRYVGTRDGTWLDVEDGISSPGYPGYNMLLASRTEYGTDVNDVWLPTVSRRYSNQPDWATAHHVAPPEDDADGVATVTAYDWRMRAVKTTRYSKGDPFSFSSAALPLRTTLTYLDHAGRAKVVAEFGEDLSVVPPSIDPSLMAAGTELSVEPGVAPSIADVFTATSGVRPIAVYANVYGPDGNIIERRDYDCSWDGTGTAPAYQATVTYSDKNGQVVWQQSPNDVLHLTFTDGHGRVSNEITAMPGSIDVNTGEWYELTHTRYSYDDDGNATDVVRWVRTESVGNALIDRSTGEPDAMAPNAVAMRTVSWFDAEHRVIAQADLGTESETWIYDDTAARYGSPDPTDPPTYDHSTGTIYRAGLDAGARLQINQYDLKGDLRRSVDPAGIVTEYRYGPSGRLAKKIENAAAQLNDPSRVTHYEYRFGRLVGMRVPQFGLDSPEGDENTPGQEDEYTRLRYVADNPGGGSLGTQYYRLNVVDDLFNRMSANNGQVSDVNIAKVSSDPDASGLLPGDPMPADGTGGRDFELYHPELRFIYTVDGKVAERIDHRAMSFRYEYDDLDRLKAVQVGHYRNSSGDPFWYSDDEYFYGYPANIMPDSVSLPPNLVSRVEYTYSSDGSTSQVTAFTQATTALNLSSGYTPPTGTIVSQTDFGYDALGRLISEAQGLGGPAGADEVIEYSWQRLVSDVSSGVPGYDRLESITYPGPSTDDRRRVTLEYGDVDSLDDLASRVTASVISRVDTLGIETETGRVDYGRIGDGSRSSTDFADSAMYQTYETDASTVGLDGLDRFGMPRDLAYRKRSGGLLYRNKLRYDVRGQLEINQLTQVDASGATTNNVRSTLNEYDELGRLVRSDTGDLVLTYPTGEPAAELGGVQIADSWSLDSVGNRISSVNPADIAPPFGDLTYSDLSAFMALHTQQDPEADIAEPFGEVDSADMDLFIKIYNKGYAKGRTQIGNMDGYGTSFAQPGADSAVDTLEESVRRNLANEITYHEAYDDGVLQNMPAFDYDRAGNLAFDGQYYYTYDAWNRLVQINAADWGDHDQDPGTPDTAVAGDVIKGYAYDGVGRLAQTRSPHAALSNEWIYERFYYDGVRRVQIRTDDTSVAGTGFVAIRDYIWGPGDAGLDEALAFYQLADAGDLCYYSIRDVNGDLVAICDLIDVGHGVVEARVASQWTYDSYGRVRSLDIWHASPDPAFGHRCLFADRLDVTTAVKPQGDYAGPFRGEPHAQLMYYSRNRSFLASSGRFMQRDPNATGLMLVSQSGWYGGTTYAERIREYSLSWNLVDGVNTYLYLRGNPVLGSDPMGLQLALPAPGVGAAVVGGAAAGALLVMWVDQYSNGLTNAVYATEEFARQSFEFAEALYETAETSIRSLGTPGLAIHAKGQADALRQINGVHPQIEVHVEKIMVFTAGATGGPKDPRNHWFEEMEAWLRKIEQNIPRLGRRTGEAWKKYIDDTYDFMIQNGWRGPGGPTPG